MHTLPRKLLGIALLIYLKRRTTSKDAENAEKITIIIDGVFFTILLIASIIIAIIYAVVTSLLTK